MKAFDMDEPRFLEWMTQPIGAAAILAAGQTNLPPASRIAARYQQSYSVFPESHNRSGFFVWSAGLKMVRLRP
jgi:hypothetical protein